MTDARGTPQGRFKRMWMEFEVELVDVDALRAFDLHALNDEQGNFLGLVEIDDNERIGWALDSIFTVAMQKMQSDIGFKYRGGLPQVRFVDDNGDYTALTLPPMPGRKDDGSLDPPGQDPPPEG